MTEEIEKYGKSTLPDIEVFKQTMDNVYKIVSQKPKQSQVKINEYKNNAKYLEIGYIESQLDRLFLSWDWEVIRVQSIANGIVVNGNLSVLTHNMNKIKRSGVGSVELQTASGSGKLKMDLSNMAKGAMDRDAARAEAYALKNAAAKLGNAFGRGLNRDFDYEHIPSENITSKIFNNEIKEENE